MARDRNDWLHVFTWHQLSYGALLATLLLLAALHPIVEGRYVGERIHNGIVFLLLIAAAFSPVQDKRQFYISLSFAAPALLIAPVAWYYKTDGLRVTSSVFVFLLLGYVTVAILRDVFRGGTVTFEKICGAICGYLLIGVIWGLFYALIASFDPHAIAVASSVHGGEVENPEHSIFSYYSFVTLSTLGYGDMTPTSAVARTFSWLEAIIGQLYLTVLIARLVGLHIAHEMKQKTASN